MMIVRGKQRYLQQWCLSSAGRRLPTKTDTVRSTGSAPHADTLDNSIGAISPAAYTIEGSRHYSTGAMQGATAAVSYKWSERLAPTRRETVGTTT